ncbi:MAG: hypothetical protein IPL61_25755 [Myxococcales bacterium]|nr:hypothetical protein [Myxococcales bacterium]
MTTFAAACLRAVDGSRLNALFDDAGQCRRYRAIRDEAAAVLAAAPAGGNRMSAIELAELAAILSRHGRAAVDDEVAEGSLTARALAQAVHEERRAHLWSYFADWDHPRKLEPGDPVPVPTRTELHHIYRRPLRLSPCPDKREGPHEMCPGGYRGLPSLRLMPPSVDGEVYLDPSLGQEVCPFTAGAKGAGTVAFIVPATHLDEGFTYEVIEDEAGVPLAFERVQPRDPDALHALVLRELARAAEYAALVVMPELTSAPNVEDAIDASHAHNQLGHIQLLVAGSTWRPPEDDSPGGSNRSAIWPRGRARHHHDKYSWFHHKATGGESIKRGRRRVTIMAGPRLTYTVLICKDVLEPWHDPFARSIADLGWGTVVLANIPPDGTARPDYGLIVRPASPAGPQETGHVESHPLSGLHNHSILLGITGPIFVRY